MTIILICGGGVGSNIFQFGHRTSAYNLFQFWGVGVVTYFNWGGGGCHLFQFGIAVYMNMAELMHYLYSMKKQNIIMPKPSLSISMVYMLQWHLEWSRRSQTMTWTVRMRHGSISNPRRWKSLLLSLKT